MGFNGREASAIENQRFKERRSLVLNPLSPEAQAMLEAAKSKVVTDPVVIKAMNEPPPSWEQRKPLTKKQRKEAKRVARGDVQRTPKAKGAYAPDPNNRKSFYASWEWRRLRMEILTKYGHRCQSCGAGVNDITITGANVRLVVDHIKPLGKNWELRLDPDNLQVLGDECNMGKGDWLETDFRPRG